MKIIKMPNKNTITPSEMKDGDIAVIREWSPSINIGLIVQRYNKDLVVLGAGHEGCFRGLSSDFNCRVEVLPKGTVLEI